MIRLQVAERGQGPQQAHLRSPPQRCQPPETQTYWRRRPREGVKGHRPASINFNYSHHQVSVDIPLHMLIKSCALKLSEAQV